MSFLAVRFEAEKHLQGRSSDPVDYATEIRYTVHRIAALRREDTRIVKR